MNALKTSVSALALAAMAAGGLGAATLMPAAYAQTAQTAPAAAAAPGTAWHHGHRHFDAATRARFVEGRIAYIKAVLGITPAQESAFNGLADAIRANAKARADAWEQVRANLDKPKNAVDRLEMRVQMIKMREAGQERVLSAFKPLYAALTPDQQKIADRVLAGQGRHGMHGRHG
jgi:uncharacterized protein YhaN